MYMLDAGKRKQNLHTYIDENVFETTRSFRYQ